MDSNDILSSENLKNEVERINAYVSKIDIKTHEPDSLDLSELVILGNNRVITTNESEKKVVLKNNNIIKVKYKDHLYNNFIKSKIFYYNNNELICIKVIEVKPDQKNKAALYKRTIYVYNNVPILDSDLQNESNPSTELVTLGKEYLINEYQALN